MAHHQRTADGYRGIWYFNQPQDDTFRYKYSGGFATYPQQHIPLAVYAPAVHKTFFCYGGVGTHPRHHCTMVAYFDHATGTVPRPTIVLTRQTHDAHYNPTLQLDAQGYIFVFCNSHGAGFELDPSDPTYAKSYIFRSDRPYDVSGFTQVREDNFSYSQVWHIPQCGLLWLHTRYAGNVRRLFSAASPDGAKWSEPQPVSVMGLGNYQISWADAGRVATALDYHPDPGGLNARTNIYYLETRDFGTTWQTVDGHPLRLPLATTANPALVHDYAADGLLVYLKDLAFDSAGHPVILYITSHSAWSGPAGDPRHWCTARWTGTNWEVRPVCSADHNYDHGSLYIEDDRWRIVAPTEPGPQPRGTGGTITSRVSQDRGATWTVERRFDIGSGRNQTYVRKPVNAHPDFTALWADGDAFAPSISNVYFASAAGDVYRLPPAMDGETAMTQLVLGGADP